MSNSIPDLDATCGSHFSFRDLIECGETWSRLAPENVPREPLTYQALRALCEQTLDPVWDALGPVKLTYGFAGPGLTRHIHRHIAPRLDQHASHEVNRHGRMVCPRGGAAADFLVDEVDSLALARWVVRRLPFDRLYYYGPDRPVHASVSKSPRGLVVLVLERDGKRHPRTIRPQRFLDSTPFG